MNNTRPFKARIAEFKLDYPDIITMDGFDDCIIGVAQRFGQEDHVAYSIPKIIKKLMEWGSSEEEATEFFYFNQLGAWVGETTPCFIEELQ